ncbi:hypothetical protein Pint_10661 [Pistacia integerrima]|uniref:Uncharacterized protein n=1 Tax=Pistacia integerrima TaxID=434235 RepID=A0ACC0XN18_9ROSI|nr:hypothetical protein Pint_10661 [Pistacia integerrima]
MGEKVDYSVQIKSDTISSIMLATNPTFHAHTKHIEIHYHFIREKVFNKEIEMVYVSTDDEIIDIFTKSLSVEKFIKFKASLGMKNAGTN